MDGMDGMDGMDAWKEIVYAFRRVQAKIKSSQQPWTPTIDQSEGWKTKKRDVHRFCLDLLSGVACGEMDTPESP